MADDREASRLVGIDYRHTFGIANFSRAGRAVLDVDALAAAILSDLGDVRPSSFRVSARQRLPDCYSTGSALP